LERVFYKPKQDLGCFPFSNQFGPAIGPPFPSSLSSHHSPLCLPRVKPFGLASGHLGQLIQPGCLYPERCPGLTPVYPGAIPTRPLLDACRLPSTGTFARVPHRSTNRIPHWLTFLWSSKTPTLRVIPSALSPCRWELAPRIKSNRIHNKFWSILWFSWRMDLWYLSACAKTRSPIKEPKVCPLGSFSPSQE
jgi:hypothetical protein